jgi:hypothetical protein
MGEKTKPENKNNGFFSNLFRDTGDFTNINPNPYCQEACIESSEQDAFETFFNNSDNTLTENSIILFGYTDSVNTEDEKQGCFITKHKNNDGKPYYYEHIIGKTPTINNDFAGKKIVLTNSHTNRGEPGNLDQHDFHAKYDGKSPSIVGTTNKDDYQHGYYLDRIIKDTIYICYDYNTNATIFKIELNTDNTFTKTKLNNNDDNIIGSYRDNKNYSENVYEIFNEYANTKKFTPVEFIPESTQINKPITINKQRANTGGIFVCKYVDETNDDTKNIVQTSEKTYNNKNDLYYWVVGLIDQNSSKIICSMWTSEKVKYKLNMYSNAANDSTITTIKDADAIMTIIEEKILDNRYTFEVSTDTMDINVSNLFTSNVLNITPTRCIQVLDNKCENIELDINFKQMKNNNETNETSNTTINNPDDAATAEKIAKNYLLLLTKDSNQETFSQDNTNKLNEYITILKCRFLKSPLLNSYITEYIKNSLSKEQNGTQESTKSRTAQEKYNKQIKEIRKNNVQYILNKIQQMQITKSITKSINSIVNSPPLGKNIKSRIDRINEYSTGGFDATAVNDSNKFVKLKFGSFDYQKLYNFTNKIGKDYTDQRQPPETLDSNDNSFSFENFNFGDYDSATYSTSTKTNKYNKKRTVFEIMTSTMSSNPKSNTEPGIRVPIGTMSITTGQLNKYNTSAISVNRPKPQQNDKNSGEPDAARGKPDNMYIVFITKNGNLSIFGKYFTTVKHTNTSMYNTITELRPIKLACRYYIDIDNSHKIVEEVVNPLLNYDYKDFKYKPLPVMDNNENTVFEPFDIKPSEYWTKHFELRDDDLSEWEKKLNNFEKLKGVSNFDANNKLPDPLNSNPSNASSEFNTEFTATFNNMYGVNSGGSHKRKTHNRKTHKRKTHKRKMHKHKRKTHK